MDDWKEYKRLILVMIDDNKKDHEILSRDMADIKTEIALLKIKSGIWGGVAGMFSTLVAVVSYLKVLK